MRRHDKHEIPKWLEEELQDIDQMIGILQAVKSSAYSLSSSPVDVLVSLLVDLIMRIKNSYEHDLPETEDLNDEIIFLDDEPMGELGNSRQKTIKLKSHLNWSPVYRQRDTSPMPRVLRALAVFFSRSLDQDFNFQKSFHDFFEGLNQFLPPGVLSQKSINAEKSKQNIKKQIPSKGNNFYYRRRQNK